MKKTNVFVLTLITALLLSACGAPPENKPANVTTNTNTAKPVAAAPTTDMLMDMERKAQEAYANGDSAHFEGILSEKMIMSMGKEHMNKAGVVAMIKTAKCDLTDGVELSDPQMSKIDNDTYAFAYRNESTGKCLDRGKMVNMTPMRAATVWVRNGEKWQATWHSETKIVEPKADAKKEEVKKADAAKAESAQADVSAKADVSKDEAKKADAKKNAAVQDAPKKEAARRDELKKEEGKKDDKTAVPAAAPVKPVASANTDALVKLHQAGWEAWKNKDAKAFEQTTTSTLAFVDPMGKWFGNKADVIREWTENKCTGVTKVSVTEGFAAALSPTVEILEHKGTADGTCDGQKNGALWGSAVYVKEGSDWKLAFLFETPAM